MCGRFTLHTEKELLARTFEVDLSGVDLTASYHSGREEEWGSTN